MKAGMRQHAPVVSAFNSGAHSAGVHQILRGILKGCWGSYRKALKRCRKDFGEDSVHQLRIETRRMLALLELVRPFHPLGWQRVELRFKKLFKSSAALRDTQVQLLYLEQDRKAFRELKPFRKYLRKRESRLSRKFRKKVQAGPKPRLKKSMKGIQRWFGLWRHETELEPADARKLLEGLQARRAMVFKARAAVKAAEPGTIHQLRIAFKAYRYIVELVAPYLKGVTPAHLKALRNYQGLMGEIQDIEVLLGLIRKFLSRHKSAALHPYRLELNRRHEILIGRFLREKLPALGRPLTLVSAPNGD